MNIQPTLHNEFHFAEGTDSFGCCCFFKSKSKPKRYIVTENMHLKPCSKPNHRERIRANQRLGEILKSKFNDDPIKNDVAFEMLKMKINDNLKNGDPITSDRLVNIVSALHELKKEIKCQENINS